jgi:hypothetical protein
VKDRDKYLMCEFSNNFVSSFKILDFWSNLYYLSCYIRAWIKVARANESQLYHKSKQGMSRFGNYFHISCFAKLLCRNVLITENSLEIRCLRFGLVQFWKINLKSDPICAIFMKRDPKPSNNIRVQFSIFWISFAALIWISLWKPYLDTCHDYEVLLLVWHKHLTSMDTPWIRRVLVSDTNTTAIHMITLNYVIFSK